MCVGLHHDGAWTSVNREVGEDEWRSRVVVPVVGGRCVVVAYLLAVVSAESEDGSGIEIFALASQLVVPGRCVSSAEIDEVKLRIVDNRVPRASAASRFPPFT